MTCNHFGQSSIVFGHGLNPQALLLRHSPLKRTLASAYPPKPLLFTLLGIGACHMLRADQETVEVSNYRAGTSKLLQYRSLEQRLKTVEHPRILPKPCLFELSRRDLKTVAISVTRAKPKNCRAYRETVKVSNYRAGTSNLSQYRSLEQSLCSSRSRNCRGIELSSRDFKTVAISVTQAKLYCINTWFACTSPSPEAQSPAGDLASAYPPKPLLLTLLGVGT